MEDQWHQPSGWHSEIAWHVFVLLILSLREQCFEQAKFQELIFWCTSHHIAQQCSVVLLGQEAFSAREFDRCFGLHWANWYEEDAGDSWLHGSDDLGYLEFVGREMTWFTWCDSTHLVGTYLKRGKLLEIGSLHIHYSKHFIHDQQLCCFQMFSGLVSKRINLLILL